MTDNEPKPSRLESLPDTHDFTQGMVDPSDNPPDKLFGR